MSKILMQVLQVNNLIKQRNQTLQAAASHQPLKPHIVLSIIKINLINKPLTSYKHATLHWQLENYK